MAAVAADENDNAENDEYNWYLEQELQQLMDEASFDDEFVEGSD